MTGSLDQVSAVVWVCVTGLLAWSGWSVASRAFPGGRGFERVGHVIVICWGQVVVAAVVVSGVGALTPIPLLTAGAVVAVLTRVAVGRLLPVSSGSGSDGGRGWDLVWVVVFAVWVGHVVVGGLFRFPDDWDTLMYHLPLVDHWLQARSLYAPDALRWCELGNNELLALWLVAPFSGDFLFALNNLPAAVLLACATREVARQVGASPVWENLGALAVVSNNVLFHQLTTAENDVAAAALFLAALGYGLRYAANGQPADLVLGAVSLGLLAGVKFYALGYVAVAAAVLFGLITYHRGRRAALGAAAIGAAGVLVFAGYWYARNWACGGSPLPPMRYPGMWDTTFVGNGRPELFRLGVAAVWGMAGPCHVAAFLALPVAAGTLLLGTLFLGGRAAGRGAVAAAAVGAGLVLLVTPFAVEDRPGTLNQMHWQYCPVRYGMCFLSLAVIVLATVLDRACRTVPGRLLGSSIRFVVAAAFAAGVAVQVRMVAVRPPTADLIDCALVAVVVLLVAANVAWSVRLSLLLRWRLAAAVVAAGVVGTAVGVGAIAGRWHDGFAPFYDRLLGRGLIEHTDRQLPRGSAVCVLDLRPYPFFGSARQFRVCQPGTVTGYAEWAEYLRSRQVVLVVARFDLSHVHGWLGWALVEGWMADHPATFERLEEPEPYTVYRVE